MTEFDIPFSAAQAREVIAETLLVFDLALLCFIAAHLRREVRIRGWTETRSRLGNQAAIAVGFHIVGLTMIRTWTTLQYYLTRQSISATSIEDAYPIALIGLVIAMFGMACCIRIFSPRRWGHLGWILAFMAAIGFVGFMQAS